MTDFPTPQEFAEALIEPFGKGARVWIKSDRSGNPRDWTGRIAKPSQLARLDADQNHWISAAAYPRHAPSRKMEDMSGVAAVVIDDPTTKGDVAKLFQTLGRPTARIRTSKSSWHWWYFLREPASEAQARPVLARIKALGLGDSSGNNANRYARLPYGVNSKREHKTVFRVRGVEWTGRRFDIEKIAKALGADLPMGAERTPAREDRSNRASDEELESDIASGKSFHGPMTALTMRAIARGEPARDARRRLEAMMLESAGRTDPERAQSWQTTFDDIGRMIETAMAKCPQGVVRSRLRRADNGKVIPDEENLRVILEGDPALQGLLRYDEFSMRRILSRPIPGDPAVVASDEYPRQWRDEDTVAIQQYIQRNYSPAVAREKVDGALGAWSRGMWSFHPIREYLDKLKWDSRPRLDSWLLTYMGAGGAPREYLTAIGPKWMIAAIARVIEPGCQADYALVMEGSQGRKKSSALRALAGDEFFSDSLPSDLSSKDAADHIRGKWIIELPELAQFRKSEIETVKSFITRRVERFRPAYGRNEIEYLRQCVFAGTTNEDQYLVDDTGNRRFWPVTCHGVNLAALKRDRDQLWAEAYDRYVLGERWYLETGLEGLAAKQTERRRLDDPWKAELAEILSTGDLRSKDELRPGQALDALGVTKEKLTPFNAGRIGKILRSLGWSKKPSNLKVYVRPVASK